MPLPIAPSGNLWSNELLVGRNLLPHIEGVHFLMDAFFFTFQEQLTRGPTSSGSPLVLSFVLAEDLSANVNFRMEGLAEPDFTEPNGKRKVCQHEVHTAHDTAGCIKMPLRQFNTAPRIMLPSSIIAPFSVAKRSFANVSRIFRRSICCSSSVCSFSVIFISANLLQPFLLYCFHVCCVHFSYAVLFCLYFFQLFFCFIFFQSASVRAAVYASESFPDAPYYFRALSSSSTTIRSALILAYFLSTDSRICHGAKVVLVFWIISLTATSY